MRRFYIVKRAPKDNRVCDADYGNKCMSREEAIQSAKELTSQTRKRHVVLKSVCAFEPLTDICEVPIED